MYETAAHPKSLNDAEKLILRAMKTRSYGGHVSRPAADTLRYAFEGTARESEFRNFQGDASQVLEWLTVVASSLCEDRVSVPTRPAPVKTWDEAIAEVRRLVTEKFAADNAEAQVELDEAPEVFAQFHLNLNVVVDGTVTDSWGASLSGPVFWWLDNVTLVGVWLVFQAVSDAATECMAENLFAWTLSNKGGDDPRKVTHETYHTGMRMLDQAICDLLNK